MESILIILVILLMVYGPIFISVLIHEAGHFIAARIVNYPVVIVKAGPFCMMRPEQKWLFRLEMPLYTGFVMCVPSPEQRTLRNEAIFFVGGIVANLVLGLTLPLFYITFGGIFENSLLMLIGIASVFIGIINTLPIKVKIKGLESDGVTLLKIYKAWRAQSFHE